MSDQNQAKTSKASVNGNSLKRRIENLRPVPDINSPVIYNQESHGAENFAKEVLEAPKKALPAKKAKTLKSVPRKLFNTPPPQVPKKKGKKQKKGEKKE